MWVLLCGGCCAGVVVRGCCTSVDTTQTHCCSGSQCYQKDEITKLVTWSNYAFVCARVNVCACVRVCVCACVCMDTKDFVKL